MSCQTIKLKFFTKTFVKNMVLSFIQTENERFIWNEKN